MRCLYTLSRHVESALTDTMSAYRHCFDDIELGREVQYLYRRPYSLQRQRFMEEGFGRNLGQHTVNDHKLSPVCVQRHPPPSLSFCNKSLIIDELSVTLTSWSPPKPTSRLIDEKYLQEPLSRLIYFLTNEHPDSDRIKTVLERFNRLHAAFSSAYCTRLGLVLGSGLRLTATDLFLLEPIMRNHADHSSRLRGIDKRTVTDQAIVQCPIYLIHRSSSTKCSALQIPCPPLLSMQPPLLCVVLFNPHASLFRPIDSQTES
jgi:hypothetical protein